MFASPHASNPDLNSLKAENDWVASRVVEHPDQLVGFFSVNPVASGSAAEIPLCSDNTGLADRLQTITRPRWHLVVFLADKEVARTRAVLGSPVIRVGQRAGLERQASAPDATCELIPQLLEFLDTSVERRSPIPGEPGPVHACRCSVVRQFVQGSPDLLKGESHPLRNADEGDSSQ